MPALNFKAQFADAVAIGTKRQTIRAARKHPIKQGDMLHLFTGMRTKACRRLRRAICTRVRPITIHVKSRTSGDGLAVWVWIDDEMTPHGRRACDAFARADGFEDFQALGRFFLETHGPHFEGQLIEWEQNIADEPRR